MRFLLVDRIEKLTRGESATGIKCVAISEEFFVHHFPERPVMPGSLILECLVQLADLLVQEESDFERLGMLAEVSRLKLRRMALPGDRLDLSVDVTSRDTSQVQFKGKATCEGSSVAMSEFSLALHPLGEWRDPVEARRWFSLISVRR